MNGIEALLAMNRHLHQALTNALEGVTDEQLGNIARELDERSLVEVAVHAYRPVLAATAVVAENTWPARHLQPTSKDALLDLIGAMVSEVEATLERLPERALAVPVELRWGRCDTGLEAIVECLAHGFVHAGAIRGARAIGGFPTAAEV